MHIVFFPKQQNATITHSDVSAVRASSRKTLDALSSKVHLTVSLHLPHLRYPCDFVWRP